MFGMLFKQKTNKTQSQHKVVNDLYVGALTHTRMADFYESFGVPDSFDGRFDLLLLHIFLILHPLQGQENYDDLSQALFDETFRNMDQTLREIGIGDVGIPKHMRRMMKAFNGRMHAYQMAIAPESLQGHDIEGLVPTTLDQALRRNLYGTISQDEGFDNAHLEKMMAFIHSNLGHKTDEDIQALLNGHVKFVMV
tara:strand:- start:140 stop:724 length:585 start_codon:yes stop_codon:yes gene_type:complete